MSTAEIQSGEKLSTNEVMDRIRKRYADTGYAVLREVADGTGSASRWADAICMSLWPSRGLQLIGIEIKVSRSDWLKELRDPTKAETICRYCDRWYLAVGDKSIIKANELPEKWGLLVPHGDGLKVSVEAKELTPDPIDRRFLAAIMRRSAEQSVDKAALEHEYKRGQRDARIDESIRSNSTLARIQKRVAELESEARQFEQETGVTFQWRWSNKKSAEVFRKLRPIIENESKLMSDMKALKDHASRITSTIDELINLSVQEQGAAKGVGCSEIDSVQDTFP